MSSGTGPLPAKTGGGTKIAVGAIYADLCQHLTPPLAGYLNMRYPILGDQLSFELVVAVESLAGAALVKFTPQHFVDSIKSSIIWGRYAVKGIWNALVGQLPPQPPE